MDSSPCLQLIKDYQQLSKEEKVKKMIAIIEYLWSEYDFYESTLALLHSKEINEKYLDALYSALITAFSELYEENKHMVYEKVIHRFHHIQMLNDAEAEQSLQEAHKLLNAIENR